MDMQSIRKIANCIGPRKSEILEAALQGTTNEHSSLNKQDLHDRARKLCMIEHTKMDRRTVSELNTQADRVTNDASFGRLNTQV